jgi:hypothetical protein
MLVGVSVEIYLEIASIYIKESLNSLLLMGCDLIFSLKVITMKKIK